jgi:hypothetical protein
LWGSPLCGGGPKKGGGPKRGGGPKKRKNKKKQNIFFLGQAGKGGVCNQEARYRVRRKKRMSMYLLKLNEANNAIKSGSAIGVSKEAFEGAMGRGRAEEIAVCDGAELEVVVFFEGSHRGTRAKVESNIRLLHLRDAQVVEEALRDVKGPRLVRFHLAVEGERKRKAVWVAAGSRLESALRGMVVEEMHTERNTEEAPKAEEPMAPMETVPKPMETQVPKPKETEGPETQETEEPKKKEPEVPETQETEVPMAPKETEGPMAPEEATEVAMVPKTQETKAEKAARLRDEARLAAEAAEEAEAAAEEEAAVEREAERKETELELERAAARVDGLQRKLKQQNELERRKRAREDANAESGESRRVAARKEEIVMVYDRQFREAMGAHGGAVRHVWVERFDRQGSRGNWSVRGNVMVLESVYFSRAEAAEAEELLALLATPATCTVTEGEVVVKGVTAVKQYDAWMEKKKFVKRTIDIDLRCTKTEGPMEPDWYQDTERVWVKMGSAELAALDKLIANERARKWQWQCPESPRSPVYRPVRPARPAYAYVPSPVDDDDDDERNFVD